jgi:hypothetical protein
MPRLRSMIASNRHTDQPLCFGFTCSNTTGKDREKFPFNASYINAVTRSLHINKTLAGVAQSVERVALTTARSPQGRGFEPLLRLFLYQAQTGSCSFAFCYGSSGRRSVSFGDQLCIRAFITRTEAAELKSKTLAT